MANNYKTRLLNRASQTSNLLLVTTRKLSDKLHELPHSTNNFLMLEVTMNKLPVSALASGFSVTLTVLLGVQVFGVFVLLSFLRSGVIRKQINPAIEVVQLK